MNCYHRIKTFKLTLTIVLTFIVCGLPFYSSTLINVLFRDELKNYNLYGINISNYNLLFFLKHKYMCIIGKRFNQMKSETISKEIRLNLRFTHIC
jgi:hypothetical protein